MESGAPSHATRDTGGSLLCGPWHMGAQMERTRPQLQWPRERPTADCGQRVLAWIRQQADTKAATMAAKLKAGAVILTEAPRVSSSPPCPPIPYPTEADLPVPTKSGFETTNDLSVSRSRTRARAPAYRYPNPTDPVPIERPLVFPSEPTAAAPLTNATTRASFPRTSGPSTKNRAPRIDESPIDIDAISADRITRARPAAVEPGKTLGCVAQTHTRLIPRTAL